MQLLLTMSKDLIEIRIRKRRMTFQYHSIVNNNLSTVNQFSDS